MNSLKITRSHSFVAGIAVCLLLVGLIYGRNTFYFHGGIFADSPNGLFRISVNAPLSPRAGGSYTIELIGKNKSLVIRKLVMTVPHSEQTVSVRDGRGTVIWDATSSYADIAFDGADAVRVWIPKKGGQQ